VGDVALRRLRLAPSHDEVENDGAHTGLEPGKRVRRAHLVRFRMAWALAPLMRGMIFDRRTFGGYHSTRWT